ncbi:beta-microseminoprotein-like [Polypterus senegalus]|uniref:beta-microseminoprotein-like n=1 Tax=Polypterus senegalus TaxID=55291 RepID=UPI001965B3B8|nr:beta-microseminoprotein-like [Polypterus senegalus]
MNIFLCLALGLLATATLCQGFCFVLPRVLDTTTGRLPNGCIDAEGTIHQIGNAWNDKDCNRCKCLKHGIGCCSQIPRYFGLPESCKVVVNKDCTHKLVNENDPDSVCVPRGAVG